MAIEVFSLSSNRKLKFIAYFFACRRKEGVYQTRLWHHDQERSHHKVGVSVDFIAQTASYIYLKR